jgi:hypothetical protein
MHYSINRKTHLLQPEFDIMFPEGISIKTEAWSERILDNIRQLNPHPSIMSNAGPFSRSLVQPYSQSDLLVDMDTYVYGLRLLIQAGKALGFSKNEFEMMSNTCALGIKKPTHYFVEEFGVSMSTADKFPGYIIDAVKAYLIHHLPRANDLIRDKTGVNMLDMLNDYSSVHATYPRGKNTGLPLVAAGANRLLNDLIMIVNARLAQDIVDNGIETTRRISDSMLHAYINFSRHQHKGGKLPLVIDNTRAISNNFEVRRRVVKGTVKSVAMANKPFVKWWTDLRMMIPAFIQDRKEMEVRLKGKLISASDVSRFDLNVGGVKLHQALNDVMIPVAKHFNPAMPDSVIDSLNYELDLPSLVPYGYGGEADMYLIPHDPMDSGCSFTSASGSVINLMIEMFVTAKVLGTTDSSQICAHFIKHEPNMILGDDSVTIYPPSMSHFMEKYRSYRAYTSELGLTVEEEVPARFLGYLLDTDKGLEYNRSSILQKLFFPEQIRKFPVLSYHPKQELLEADSKLFYIYKEWVKYWGPLAQHLKHFDDPISSRRFYQEILDNATNDYDAVDEILHMVGRGSEFDMNFSLVGLPDMERLVALVSVSGSQSQVIDSLLDSASEDFKAIVKNRITLSSGHTLGVRELIDTVTSFVDSNPGSLYERYTAICSTLGRPVRTTHGDFFMV